MEPKVGDKVRVAITDVDRLNRRAFGAASLNELQGTITEEKDFLLLVVFDKPAQWAKTTQFWFEVGELEVLVAAPLPASSVTPFAAPSTRVDET